MSGGKREHGSSKHEGERVVEQVLNKENGRRRSRQRLRREIERPVMTTTTREGEKGRQIQRILQGIQDKREIMADRHRMYSN